MTTYPPDKVSNIFPPHKSKSGDDSSNQKPSIVRLLEQRCKDYTVHIVRDITEEVHDTSRKINRLYQELRNRIRDIFHPVSTGSFQIDLYKTKTFEEILSLLETTLIEQFRIHFFRFYPLEEINKKSEGEEDFNSLQESKSRYNKPLYWSDKEGNSVYYFPLFNNDSCLIGTIKFGRNGIHNFSDKDRDLISVVWNSVNERLKYLRQNGCSPNDRVH